MLTELQQRPMPARIKMLPVDPVRGIPVPWFVAWMGDDGELCEPGQGKPEFRIADAGKRVQAVLQKRCWVCGDYLGRNMTFVAGPMCLINRTSAEPPCHLECAEYSAAHCPFLSRPRMDRREGNLPEAAEQRADCDGFMIRRNPGCTALVTCRDYTPFNDGKGGWLIHMGEPISVAWYAEGRPATRAEVEESVRTGLPLLQEVCANAQERLELAKRAGELTKLYPRE